LIHANLVDVRHLSGYFAGFGGVKLHYASWLPESGTGREPVVAVVHGFGEHCARYAYLAGRLVERGFAVWAYDHRGHGRSGGVRGHIGNWTEYRDDLSSFLDRVAAPGGGGAPAVFLYAHSMGALIGLDFVLREGRARVTGIVSSGAPLEPLVGSRQLVMMARAMSRVWPEFRMKARIKPEDLSRLPEEAAAARRDPLRHCSGTARWGAEALDAIHWVNHHAGELLLPLLMLHGANDRLAAPQGSVRFFAASGSADKELHIVPGGFHEPHNDSGRDAIIARVADWMEARLPARWEPG
jgi:alpha-beta hydrolase superfamily lysophospholipase